MLEGANPSLYMASTQSRYRRKPLWFLVGFLFATGIALLAWDHRKNAPRRNALSTATALNNALTSKEPIKTLDIVTLPPTAKLSAPEEQGRWVAALLSDEINAAGIEEMRRHARFGPLVELFPEEADRWSKGAGVPQESCVALRMDRAGTRAEIVFHDTPEGLRILRCNNVKQMASTSFPQ